MFQNQQPVTHKLTFRSYVRMAVYFLRIYVLGQDLG